VTGIITLFASSAKGQNTHKWPYSGFYAPQTHQWIRLGQCGLIYSGHRHHSARPKALEG